MFRHQFGGHNLLGERGLIEGRYIEERHPKFLRGQFRKFMAIDVEGFNQIANQRHLELAGLMGCFGCLLFAKHAVTD